MITTTGASGSFTLWGKAASVIGIEDVDTDVFYAFPPGLKLAAEEKNDQWTRSRGS